MAYGFEHLVRDKYFEWMTNIVCKNRYPKQISYKKLLTHLHEREFTYILEMDGNRAEDGIDLRDRFFYEEPSFGSSAEKYLEGPCSILEMMVALALKCEENIMDDPLIGNRTGQWFWGMITNLGLGSMIDSRYNPHVVDNILNRFLNREYEPTGKGGLFMVRDRGDLRDVEIWYQLNWYLDTIT